MDRIGFGEQPYLVYKHNDAAHPHLHIVTTNIKPDGKRIDLHNIGRTLSETARKQIERDFKLVRAEGRKLSNEVPLKPVNIEHAEYGKKPTKRAITSVVNAVMKDYKFTSLAEFNAVLRCFNVTGDRGSEDTLIYQKKGLQYSITDKRGNRIGVPIKASSIFGKPTLDHLEKQFTRNEEPKKPLKEPLKASIDKVLNEYVHISKSTFVKELNQKGISAIFRQNEQGFIYGVTFVDHKNQSVFNGSSLGKAYSAKALTEKFTDFDLSLKAPQPQSQGKAKEPQPAHEALLTAREPDKLLMALLGGGQVGTAQLIPRKKHKRKKGFKL